jgi:hypothetical protein
MQNSKQGALVIAQHAIDYNVNGLRIDRDAIRNIGDKID